MKKLLATSALAISAILPTQAFAYDWSAVGRVTFIEGTYAPDFIPFKIDGGGGSCPAGTVLTWKPQKPDATSNIANSQAILSILLTAKSTNQYVNIFGDNAGCNIDYIHLD